MREWIKAWWDSDKPLRIGKTLLQVFGGVAIAFLLDWGADGVVVIRDYVFGNGGIIIVGTTALAVAMNIKH